MKCQLFIVTFLSVLITACSNLKHVASTTAFESSAYKQYKLDSNYNADSSLVQFLKPYSVEVNRQMDVVIGSTETSLEANTPEGTLGNFVTDAMRQRAALSYNKKIDLAFTSYGGLRVNNISTGPITRGKIFELMPFDNMLVLLQLRGNEVKQLLDIIASKNGWPLSGIKMKIVNGKAEEIKINNEPLIAANSYTIATTDYTAKGNEGFEMLKSFKQENNGYLLRDALIDYIKDFASKGKQISAKIDNRIVNAE